MSQTIDKLVFRLIQGPTGSASSLTITDAMAAKSVAIFNISTSTTNGTVTSDGSTGGLTSETITIVPSSWRVFNAMENRTISGLTITSPADTCILEVTIMY